MKLLHHSQEVKVDEGVTCSVKSRVVTVTGPRGTLTKNFRHLKVNPNEYFRPESTEGALIKQFILIS